MSTTYTQAELSAKTVKDLKVRSISVPFQARLGRDARLTSNCQAILSELKLSSEGKKADLVTRILEHQGGDASAAPAAGASTAVEGDAATADDDKAAASSEGTTTTAAATGTVDNAAANTSTDDAGEEKAGNGEEVKQDEAALPLPAGTSKDEEAERRINRLKRFGNPDEIAKLERMEKFGSQTDVVDEKVRWL